MSSQIIDDLTHIPNIIAGLGIGIAQAQTKLDQNYLESLKSFFALLSSVLGPTVQSQIVVNPANQVNPTDTANKTNQGSTTITASSSGSQEKLPAPGPHPALAAIMPLITALAPSRYQFTETTLSVKLDLSQHLDVSGSLGVSAGICGVAVNAALSLGFSRDYRGAAECKTVLHAIPPDPVALEKVANLARQIRSDQDLVLPAVSQGNAQLSKDNQALITQARSLLEQLGKKSG